MTANVKKLFSGGRRKLKKYIGAGGGFRVALPLRRDLRFAPGCIKCRRIELKE